MKTRKEKINAVILYTTSFRGIGPITLRELRAGFGLPEAGVQAHCVRDYDLNRFAFDGEVEDLLQLGTAEDVFYWIATVPLSGEPKDLVEIQSVLLPARIDPGLAMHGRLSGWQGRRRTVFRVIVQASDEPWRTYRREQMQRVVEQVLRARYTRWKVVRDRADLEFWVQQTGHQALIGLRLSDRTMRHRTYKTANLPGSLRPTLARALVYLSGVEAGDTFLDPMCGAGTILIERALSGRYGLLLGGDIREEAVRYTLENFGKKHKPREIRRWDATRLPLDDRSVDKVATNLPWGRQMGSFRENRALYAGALKEVDRVLRPGGRAVFLTSEWDLFRKSQRAAPGLKPVDQVRNIAVLGRRADIFVLEKQER